MASSSSSSFSSSSVRAHRVSSAAAIFCIARAARARSRRDVTRREDVTAGPIRTDERCRTVSPDWRTRGGGGARVRKRRLGVHFSVCRVGRGRDHGRVDVRRGLYDV